MTQTKKHWPWSLEYNYRPESYLSLYKLFCKKHQRQFAFIWRSQQWTFTLLSRSYINSALCYKVVCRAIDCLDTEKNMTLLIYIIWCWLCLRSRKWKSDASVQKKLCKQEWDINPIKIQWPTTSVRFLGVLQSGERWKISCCILHRLPWRKRYNAQCVVFKKNLKKN